MSMTADRIAAERGTVIDENQSISFHAKQASSLQRLFVMFCGQAVQKSPYEDH